MDEEILKTLRRIEEKLDNQNFITSEKGALRKCDNLGRVTLPITIRRNLDINEDTSLKIICAGGKIIIEKAEQ
jgi:hypothetical protein